MNRKRFLTTAALLSVPVLLAAAGFDAKVRNDFFAGFGGDQAAMERGMKLSGEAIAADPNAAEALSWHGSGLLLLSGQKFQAGDMNDGMALWSKAIAEMDKAGELAPESVGVLVPRAASWLATSRFAPPQMGRPLLKKGLADYEKVYELQKSYFDTLDMHMRSELLFGLADGYYRDENPAKAKEYFEKIVALGPQSGHAAQARSYLDTGKFTVTGLGCVGCHTGK